MNKVVYLDTSVLLPIMVAEHANHRKCLSLIEEVNSRGAIVYTTNHTYAELYSNLTKLPHQLKIPPREAASAIIHNWGNIITTIDLTGTDYEAALRRCAERELTSGIIYDALHLQAAVKAKVDILYTANLKDFERLYSPDLGFELAGV